MDYTVAYFQHPSLVPEQDLSCSMSLPMLSFIQLYLYQLLEVLSHVDYTRSYSQTKPT
jgi:hypothetical protein